MLSRTKYRRLPDLYTTGTELVLKDGSVLWVQVPNSFERDEARHDATVARSRLTLALKEFGSDELTKVRGEFLREGREAAVQALVSLARTERYLQSMEALRSDPDWAERLEVLERSEDLAARPVEDAERKLLEAAQAQYEAELLRRWTDETELLTQLYAGYTEDALWDAYLEMYLERRGNDVALAEFQLTELWYAVRACEGIKAEDSGEWDHTPCEGHRVRVFDSKTELRELPAELLHLLRDTLAAVSMTEYQAKNSDRLRSSSPSFPQPSAAEGQTPSTPAATPDAPLGTSSTPSTTP